MPEKKPTNVHILKIQDLRLINEKKLIAELKPVPYLAIASVLLFNPNNAIEFKLSDYGKRIIERLAIDLKWPESGLWRIVQFYRPYKILSIVSRELSSSHYVELLVVKNT